jgi:putative transcriptional regulator
MAKKIKVNIYDDMRQSLGDAIAYERGEQVDLRVAEIPAPPKRMKPTEIRDVRLRLRASQAVFAHFLCVSPKAVQSWEQGIRVPQMTALRLINIAKDNPAVLLRAYGSPRKSLRANTARLGGSASSLRRVHKPL